jgi:endonuclease/exonuclease/phosphatase family metal-dependent hydrolase
MKIATYNVRNLFDPGTCIDDTKTEVVQEHFFNQRVAYFIEQLRVLDLDIVCLQEIGGEKGVIMISEALGYTFFSAKPNKRGIRMSVLYKKTTPYRVVCSSVSFGELTIPSIQEAGDTSMLKTIEQRRDVLVIDIDSYNGKPLRIVTFHLKSLIPSYLEGDNMETDQVAHTDAKFRSIFYKMMELRALRAYADTSLNEGKELVFLGDFNDNNNSSGLEILKSSPQDEKRLSDVLAGFGGDKTSHMHRGNKLTFDTLIVSAGIKAAIASVHVENKELKDYSSLPWGDIEHEIQSDHAMVWVELQDVRE